MRVKVFVAPARAGAGLLALFALTGAGCRERTCAGADPPVLEVRDRDGNPEMALRPLGDSLAVCDDRNRRVGNVKGGKSGLVLADLAGNELLALKPSPDPGDTLATRPGTTPLRLHDEADLLRILDPQGVPLAQLGADKRAAQALAYDPAGNPLVYAELADDRRRVVRGRDGAVQHYVLGARSNRAAAAIGLPMFPPLERLVLCRWLDLQ